MSEYITTYLIWLAQKRLQSGDVDLDPADTELQDMFSEAVQWPDTPQYIRQQLADEFNKSGVIGPTDPYLTYGDPAYDL